MDKNAVKKKRLQFACDSCKRRKVRCDSGIMPNSVCSGCLNAGLECTHSSVKQKRGPKPTPRKGNHSSLESAQILVSSILAEPETYPIPEGPEDIRALLVAISRYAFFLSKELNRKRRPSVPTAISSAISPEEPSPIQSLADSPFAADAVVSPDGNLNDIDTNTISESLEKLSLESHKHLRHFGMSSNFILVKTLLDFKQEATGHKEDFFASAVKRPQFWSLSPWYRDIQILHAGPPLIFPDNDLLHDLIEIYFARFDPYFPLLYRDSFEQSIAEGLHFVDLGFGQVVLAVCALASRCSSDPRNMPEGTDSEHAMGWPWYRQISVKSVSSVIEPPRLYDLQLCVLMVTYLQASSTSESSWILLGVGMRLAQAMGIHRKRPGEPKSIERELWIRAFWAIITLDTYASMFLGRPRVTTMDDFDVEYPTDCDPEFWDDPKSPEKNFMQPSGNPSRTAFWIHFIKLLEIAGLVHRLIYPIRKSDHWKRLGVQGTSWNQKAVIELDSALNEWASSVPDQVKWDPDRADSIFFHQSVMLYTSYYWVQIQVHKPWIPRPDQDTILSGFPSLTICASAARACIHVAEAQKKRQASKINSNPLPIPLPSVFVSAIMLLINFWRGRRLNKSLDSAKELVDVYKCFEILRPYERRFQGAGRMIDALNGIISIGQLRYPSGPPSLVDPANDWIANTGLSISNELAGYPSSGSESLNIGTSIDHTGQQSTNNGPGRIDDNAPQISSPQPPLPFLTTELGVLPLYSSGLTKTVPSRPDNIQHTENDWSSASNANALADLSALGIGFDPVPSLSSEPISGSSIYSAASYQSQPETPSPAWEVNHSQLNENSSDGHGDWTVFMRSVDELYQSASANFRMVVDEPS